MIKTCNNVRWSGVRLFSLSGLRPRASSITRYMCPMTMTQDRYYCKNWHDEIFQCFSDPMPQFGTYAPSVATFPLSFHPITFSFLQQQPTTKQHELLLLFRGQLASWQPVKRVRLLLTAKNFSYVPVRTRFGYYLQSVFLKRQTTLAYAMIPCSREQYYCHSLWKINCFVAVVVSQHCSIPVHNYYWFVKGGRASYNTHVKHRSVGAPGRQPPRASLFFTGGVFRSFGFCDFSSVSLSRRALRRLFWSCCVDRHDNDDSGTIE
jgi:hypothetical protein